MGTFTRWWASDALGMAVMLPLVLGLQPAEVRQTVRDASWQTLCATFALMIVTNVAVFAQSRFPLVFLVIPPMLLIAFRLGYAATAAAIFITAAIALAFTVAGHGPFTLLRDLTFTQRILALQLVIAVLILTSYPVCAVVAHQRRLLRDMAAQRRALPGDRSELDRRDHRDRRAGRMDLSVAVGHGDARLDAGRARRPRRSRVRAPGRCGAVRARDRAAAQGPRSARRIVSHAPSRRPLHLGRDHLAAAARRGGQQDRSAGSANTRDISARKRVEQIQNEFIATINHELRTPLTAMLGSIALAASGKFGTPEPALARLLEMARTNGDRLAQLVNDILDFEKASSGKMRFDMRPLRGRRPDRSLHCREPVLRGATGRGDRSAAARARLVDPCRRRPLSPDHGEPSIQRGQVLAHRRPRRRSTRSRATAAAASA